MNTLNLTFDHPVQGRAFLIDSKKKVKHILPAETDGYHVIKIPLEGLSKDRWMVRFEWEYNDQVYFWKGEVSLS